MEIFDIEHINFKEDINLKFICEIGYFKNPNTKTIDYIKQNE